MIYNLAVLKKCLKQLNIAYLLVFDILMKKINLDFGRVEVFLGKDFTPILINFKDKTKS